MKNFEELILSAKELDANLNYDLGEKNEISFEIEVDEEGKEKLYLLNTMGRFPVHPTYFKSVREITGEMGEVFPKLPLWLQVQELNNRFKFAPFRKKGCFVCTHNDVCYAVLGQDYVVLSIEELLTSLKETLDKDFEEYTLLSYELNPDYSVVRVAIKDERINEVYSKILEQKVGTARCQIVLEFRTSMSGWSVASVIPMVQELGAMPLYLSKKTEMVSVPHVGKSATIDNWKEQLNELFPMLKSGAENFSKLKEIRLENPVSAFLNLCKAVGISNKKINEGQIRRVLLNWKKTKEPQTALRLYRLLGVVASNVLSEGHTKTVSEALEADILAKALVMSKARWEELGRKTSTYKLEEDV